MIFNSMYASYSWNQNGHQLYIQNLYNYINEIYLCLRYLLYFFFVKIAVIEKKSNLSYLNTNQKPFAYFQIMSSLVSADSYDCCAIK